MERRFVHGAPPSSVPVETLRPDIKPDALVAPEKVLLKLEACDRVRPCPWGSITYRSGASVKTSGSPDWSNRSKTKA